MKRYALAALLLLSLGCTKKGEKGDPGIQGMQGPGHMEVLTANVISNDFMITDSRIGQAIQASVYLGDSSTLSESPYFLPTFGVNTYWLGVSPSSIEIVNGQLAGATRVVIVLILN